MSNEKMRVLDLLESGKITADEAANLLAALGTSSRFMDKETREKVDEKLHNFANEVTRLCKNVGSKMHDFYKEVEPKVKRASQHALEKAACALENLAHNIDDSLSKNDVEAVHEDEDDMPREN